MEIFYIVGSGSRGTVALRCLSFSMNTEECVAIAILGKTVSKAGASSPQTGLGTEGTLDTYLQSGGGAEYRG